jgi:hypothetical protein
MKNALVPGGNRPRTILTGAFAGIRMNLCLKNQTQVALGLFERETHPWLQRLSLGVATAVDIGCAQGEYVLFFLKKTQAKKVYAFEPNASDWPALRDNLRLNGFDEAEPRVTVSPKFVGQADSDTAIRLDTLAPAFESPCFIKMDVDGGELDVLAGAERLNAAARDIRWLIETHSPQLEADCTRLLRSAGFRTAAVRRAWWRVMVPERRIISRNWLAAWKHQ